MGAGVVAREDVNVGLDTSDGVLPTPPVLGAVPVDRLVKSEESCGQHSQNGTMESEEVRLRPAGGARASTKQV